MLLEQFMNSFSSSSNCNQQEVNAKVQVALLSSQQVIQYNIDTIITTILRTYLINSNLLLKLKETNYLI